MPYKTTGTFMGVPTLMDGDTNKTTIVGFPFDGLVTNRPGARFGSQCHPQCIYDVV